MKILNKAKKVALMGLMSIGAYSPTYVIGDLDDITGDMIGTAGASIVSFTDLFVLGFVLLALVGVVVKLRSAWK